jgi:hypothetical protein
LVGAVFFGAAAFLAGVGASAAGPSALAGAAFLAGDAFLDVAFLATISPKKTKKMHLTVASPRAAMPSHRQ